MFYVYMLECLADGDYYKGCSQDYNKRLLEHNNGECQFTRAKRPWKLIFVQPFETKREALIREKQLKKCNKEYLRWLVNQPVNRLHNELDW